MLSLIYKNDTTLQNTKKNENQTKRDKGKNKKLNQFLQENGVAALKIIC